MTRTLQFYSKPRRASPEAALQRAVCEHLRLTARPGVLYFHPTNEGRRSVVTGANLKRMGMLPGMADLVVIMNGRTSFLELKATGEKPRDTQLAFAEQTLAAGCDYAVCDNINDALDMLRCWGAIRRARAA
jgi:hypothetical protein